MLYRTINRNKKSIVIDLKTERGREIVLDLVRHCDVLLENFRPGTLEKWGLGPEELDRVNPELVITRISAFGQTGPLSERPGFAAVAEAFGGLRELVGDPDRPPVRTGVSIGDSIAGIYAAFGTVMALFQRERVKVPLPQRVIDVALNESVLVGDGVAGAGLPGLRCHARASRRADGGHRTEQRLPLRRRHQHHRRRQRGRDLPALHADHRPTRPRRRNRSCRATRGVGSAARNSMRRSGSGPSSTTGTRRSSCSTRPACRPGRSTRPPTSAPTSSTRRET